VAYKANEERAKELGRGISLWSMRFSH